VGPGLPLSLERVPSHSREALSVKAFQETPDGGGVGRA